MRNRNLRIDHCVSDTLLERSCGHAERYQCRLVDEGKRQATLAQLRAEPCSACKLAYELAGDLGRMADLPMYQELAARIFRVPLKDLRLFVMEAISSGELNPEVISRLQAKYLFAESRKT